MGKEAGRGALFSWGPHLVGASWGPVRTLAGDQQLRGGRRGFRIQDAADGRRGRTGATPWIPPRAERVIHSMFIQLNPEQLFEKFVKRPGVLHIIHDPQCHA